MSEIVSFLSSGLYSSQSIILIIIVQLASKALQLTTNKGRLYVGILIL